MKTIFYVLIVYGCPAAAIVSLVFIPIYWDNTGPFKGYAIIKKYTTESGDRRLIITKNGDTRDVRDSDSKIYNLGDTLK
jgi:hypothetical protein